MITATGVLDLRQYTLLPGRRNDLIELFDEHFVGGQEAVGIHVVGQFRDLDDPDRFVWLRAFDSMPARADALSRFYYGPVWQRHRDAANATMLDSDNALLLQPLHLGRAYPQFGDRRAPAAGPSLVAITVAELGGPITAADRSLASSIRTALDEAGAEVVAAFATHDAENNFPALPLRTEHVLVWITRFDDELAHARHLDGLAASDVWCDALHRLAGRSSRLPLQHLRLRPTDNSQLR